MNFIKLLVDYHVLMVLSLLCSLAGSRMMWGVFFEWMREPHLVTPGLDKAGQDGAPLPPKFRDCLPDFARRLLCFHAKRSVYHHTLYCDRCDLFVRE